MEQGGHSAGFYQGEQVSEQTQRWVPVLTAADPIKINSFGTSRVGARNLNLLAIPEIFIQ
jgi:hypothetical protein